MRSIVFIFCQAGLGCVDFTEDTLSVEPSDSGSSLDSGNSAETGQVDTGEGHSTRVEAIVTAEDDSDGLRVGVRQIWLGDEELASGELLTDGLMEDGQAVLALPVPDTDALADDGSGLLYATFTVALRRDEDGDEAVQDDEPIPGVSEALLYYLASDPGVDSELQSLAEGWNAIVLLDAESDSPYLVSLDEISIAQNLPLNEELTLRGESDVAEDSAHSTRLTALPTNVEEYNALVWSSLIFDVALTASWEASVTGAPNPTHQSQEEDSPFSVIEIPMAYTDADESESLHPMVDETLHAVCFDELPVALAWIDELQDVSLAIVLHASQIQPGWSAWTVDAGDIEVLNADQLTQLSADSTCSME